MAGDVAEATLLRMEMMDQHDVDEDYDRQEHVATEPHRAPPQECRHRHSWRGIVAMLVCSIVFWQLAMGLPR